MRVAVLGASGRAGADITRELARRGHEVRALARNPDAIPTLPGVQRLAADASDARALSDVVRGLDAVISALHFDVPAATLLEALKGAGVPRLLVTGGAASLETGPGRRVIDSPDFPAEWKPFAMAGIVFLDEIRGERDVDWVFFSPAALLFEGPRLGRYRLGGDRLVTDAAGESKISFADYAFAMVDELEQRWHSRTRFTAAY